jgi:hypothetical protein
VARQEHRHHAGDGRVTRLCRAARERVLPLDVEKKQLSLAPIGGEPRTEDIEGFTVTDDAILLFGTGKRVADRTWSAVISLKTGNLSGGMSILDLSLAVSGTCSSTP